MTRPIAAMALCLCLAGCSNSGGPAMGPVPEGGATSDAAPSGDAPGNLRATEPAGADGGMSVSD